MKLHVGCGKRFIPNYYHIDAVEFPHVDLVHSVDSLPMIGDNSVEVIYSCHVLEHFHKKEVPRVLTEWYRILQPGGTLRVAVPDFAAAVDLYQHTRKIEDVNGLIFGRADYLYNIHHAIYDFETLSRILKEAGFKDPKRYDWRTTEHADTDDFSQAYYPHLDKNYGRLLSLNVEATK